MRLNDVAVRVIAISIAVFGTSPIVGRSGPMPEAAFEVGGHGVDHFDGRLFWSSWNACGQAALFAVCHDCGEDIALDRITEYVPVGEGGASMKALVDGLKALGFEAVGVRATPNELCTTISGRRNTRAIALVDGNHWVAVLNTDGETLDVFSYPRRSAVRLAAFSERYSGVAVIVSQRSESALPLNLSRGGIVLSVVTVSAAVLWLLRRSGWIQRNPRHAARLR